MAGGTNLAIRFGHRKSQDIDLFCSETVGIKHLEQIEKEVIAFYGENNLSGIDYPASKESEKYSFLRFWVTKSCGTIIKVEVIQNMKRMDNPETIDEVRLVTTKDIGLFKLTHRSIVDFQNF